MKGIVAFCLTFERGFNILGYIPLMGTLSGLIRMALALCFQITLGIISLLLGLIFGMVMTLLTAVKKRDMCIRFARFGAGLILHGRFNLMRGFIELFPLMGGLLCLVYDRMMHGEQLINYQK